MADVAFETSGRAAIAEILSAITRAVTDWRSFWDWFVEDFERMERDLFDSEGATGADRWEPLSERYAAAKARLYPGAGVLTASERLRASLEGRTADSIRVASDDQLRIGTRVPHSRYHATGTSTMPARPPISPTDQDFARWRSLGHRFLEDAVRAEVRRFRGGL